MKRFLSSFISLLLCTVLISACLSGASAAVVDRVPTGLCLDDSDNSVQTVIGFENGSTYTADGTVDLHSTEQNPIIESIETLEVLYDGESILSVEPHDIAATGTSAPAANGYYSVTFAIPDSKKEVYLTGLKPEKVDSIQKQVLDKYAKDNEFEITDIDFIDAEKTGKEDYDSNLCWAASASDMLRYSGWSNLTNYKTEDDLLDLSAENFIDKGYFAINGIEWFFNGTLGSYSPKPERFKNYPNSGGYLKDYSADTLVRRYSMREDYLAMTKQMISDLKNGLAIGLDITTSQDAAHAITLWGCITDNSFSENDIKRYCAFFISDSDDNIEDDATDRRTAPNTLRVCTYREIYDEKKMYFDTPQKLMFLDCGALTHYSSLAPYTDKVQKETDSTATKNKITTPDLVLRNARLANAQTPANTDATTAKSGDVILYIDVVNYSDKGSEGAVDVDLTLSKGGKQVKELKESMTDDLFSNRETSVRFELGSLNAGSYTAQIKVNANHSVKEAYYYNNTTSYTFEIKDSEYDISQMCFITKGADDCTDKLELVDLDYSSISAELLSKADRVTVKSSQYVNEQWLDYEPVTIVTNDDKNALLPTRISFEKYGQKYKLQLSLHCNRLWYTFESAEADIRKVDFYITPSDDSKPITPIPPDATALNDGEAFIANIKFTPVNYDKPFSGTYALAINNGDDENAEYADITERKSFTLNPKESLEKIQFSKFTSPIKNDTSVYILIKGNIDGKEYRYVCSFGNISVKVKGVVVDTREDTLDPSDGFTSLREAVKQCKETGETEIRFADNLNSAALDAPLEIDGNISIINTDTANPKRISVAKQSIFKVSEKGSLTLSGLILISVGKSQDNGGAIDCEGGTVNATNCRFKSNSTTGNGGAIYLNGGKATVKNCFFDSTSAKLGSVLYINSGDAELLNVLTDSCVADNYVIYNKGGKLNMINSMITNTRLNGDGTTVVKSDADTNIINSSIVGYRDYTSVDGTAKLYSTAYREIGDSVTADTDSKACQAKDIFKLLDGESPVVDYGELSLSATPKLAAGAKDGSYTTVKNGMVSISKDNNSFTSTNVKTAFTADNLSRDMIGKNRLAIFGPYCKIDGEVILGDADLDNAVTINDATAIQRHIAKLTTLTDDALKAADADQDGKITVFDATVIQLYLAQLIDGESIGKSIPIADKQ